MKLYDADATRAALGFDRLIPALRQLFTTGCEVPQRHTHVVRGPEESELTVLIMPAWLPGRFLGIKTVGIAPGNAALGLPGLHSTYLLHDASTGVPLALIDGNEITSRRTAAASALAASWLARRDAGNWSAQEQDAFDIWLGESTAHRVAYWRLENAWDESRRLRALAAGVLSDDLPPAGQWDRSPFFTGLAGGDDAVLERKQPVPAVSNRWRALAASVLLVATAASIAIRLRWSP